MTGWQRLARNRWLDVVSVVIALLCAARIGMVLPSRATASDFNHFYVSSRMLLMGQNPYTTPIGPIGEKLGFVMSDSISIAGYPPSFLWLFAPLAALPPWLAFRIWVMGEVACLGTILWLTRRLLSGRLSARGWLFVCAATVASQIVFWQFYYSQVQLLLAALVLGAYAWHLRGRDHLACLAVTAAGLLKVYPFVLLPWFIWRSSRSPRARAALMLVMAAVSFGVVLGTGPALWRDFLHSGMPTAIGPEVGLNFRYSLSSFVIKLGVAATGPNRSMTESSVVWATGSLVGLLAMVLAYLICWRARRDREIELSLLIVAMLAGTVTVSGQYFVWLIFPLAAAAVRVAAGSSMRRVLGFAFIASLAYNVTPPDPAFLDRHVCLWILVNHVPLYGLVALGVFLARELVQSEPGRQQTA